MLLECASALQDAASAASLPSLELCLPPAYPCLMLLGYPVL